MINQISQNNLNTKNNKFTQNFLGTKNKDLKPNTGVTLNAADKFLIDIKKIENKKFKNDFINKCSGSITALTALAIPLLYEIGTLFQISKLKKQNDIIKLEKVSKHFIRNLMLLIAGSTALYAGLSYYFNSQTDKNLEKLKKEFEKINTKTDAKISGTFKSGIAGAVCTSTSESIMVNQNIINDPILRKNIIKLIRHELIHAKQFETIARSKDGIKKLNFATFYNIRNSAQKNPLVKIEFIQIYNDIQNDKTGKYDNITININGDTYNFKKYIELVHTLLTKEDVTYNDLPIIIDAEHYKKVIEKKGKLTEEEEKKADEYFKALSNYTDITLKNAYNPFGDYRNNILEQEAYQENPSFFMKLSRKK